MALNYQLPSIMGLQIAGAAKNYQKLIEYHESQNFAFSSLDFVFHLY